MGLISYIRDWLSGDITTSTEMTSEEFQVLVAETNFREIAFWSAVNLIANSVSKCEFKTFTNNVEVKTKEHYLWNVEPNKNQNSSEFMHKFIAQLYSNNECLVIETRNGQLLVADSFTVDEYALTDNLFSQVTVGAYNFPEVFKMSDVMYFKLSENDMREVTKAIFESYGKLLTYGMDGYKKSRGTKGVLDVETVAGGTEVEKAYLTELINKRFKSFFESESSVLPLSKGFTYTDMANKTYSNEGTRDIRAMMDDISDFTAKAFGIPPALLRGDIAGIDSAMGSYLTFTINPLISMIQEEICRKRYGYDGVSKGNYIKIDMRAIKHIDLLESSTAIDKLIASGCYTANEVRDVIGDVPIVEDFGNTHFITKNYATMADVATGVTAAEPFIPVAPEP